MTTAIEEIPVSTPTISPFSSVGDSSLQRMESIIDFIIEINKQASSPECPFVPQSNRVKDISTKYTLISELGIGATARVYLAQDKETLEYVALKQLSKSEKYSIELFTIEYNMLNKVCNPICHPHIPKLLGLPFIDNKNYYIVTKYFCGGRLLDYIASDFGENFTELNACKYIKTMLEIIKFIHDKNIAHRDIKPANLLFDKKPKLHLYNHYDNKNNENKNKNGNDDMVENKESHESAKLMLIDFGLAIECKDDDINNDFVGTLVYMPPESVRERKGWELRKGDIWSIGVISYILVCGDAPFIGKNQALTMKEILEANLKWPQNIQLSKLCKDFISKLLTKEPQDRYSAKDALNDPWFELLKIDCEDSKDDDEINKNVKKSQEDLINENKETDLDDAKTESNSLTYSNINYSYMYNYKETKNAVNRKLGESYRQRMHEFSCTQTVSVDYLIINATLSTMESDDRHKMVRKLKNFATPSSSNHNIETVDLYDNAKDHKNANVKEKTIYKYLRTKGLNEEDARKRANDLAKIIASKPMYGQIRQQSNTRSEFGIAYANRHRRVTSGLAARQRSDLKDIDENDDCSFDSTTNIQIIDNDNLDADVNQVNVQYSAKISNHDEKTNIRDNTTQKQQQKDQQQQTDSEHDPITMTTDTKMEKHAQRTRTTNNFGNFVKKTANNKNEVQLDVDLDMVIILSPSENDDSSSTTIVGEEENTVNNDNGNIKIQSTVNSTGLHMKRIESESYSQQTPNSPDGIRKSADHANQFYLHSESSIDTNTNNNNNKQSIFGTFCAAFCCC